MSKQPAWYPCSWAPRRRLCEDTGRARSAHRGGPVGKVLVTGLLEERTQTKGFKTLTPETWSTTGSIRGQTVVARKAISRVIVCVCGLRRLQAAGHGDAGSVKISVVTGLGEQSLRGHAV